MKSRDGIRSAIRTGRAVACRLRLRLMFQFPRFAFDAEADELRSQVRTFLEAERASGGFVPQADCWVSAADPEFSRKLGSNGWLGMTWPKEYGGHARPMAHRFVVTEELLAAGAPVAAHWIADRQTGSHILQYGSEEQKHDILPRIAAGECFTAIGMSEPQAGSDLAAIKTAARRTDTGWVLSGRKIWSTGAHFSHYMIVLARTSPAEGRNRQVGLSQFLVDLSLPGVDISGIRDLGGTPHFNETLFEDVELPADALLGIEGNGWAQCMGELALERSGPERFLTSLIVLETAMPVIARHADDRRAGEIGSILANLRVLRRMSLGVAELLERGESPATLAAVVKEMGNRLENDVVAKLRGVLAGIPKAEWPDELGTLLRDAVLHLPSNTLRGGTTEILRGIIAREMGMR
ncbi:acyl-CoA dehydrogenase family protein [Erythrobacter sp. NAP1]|uniref:acyl-CoA dehydrogenase family protein n=1 Tax=Erythrobacter sp. NAP1 TaxID=237727 RepID=UPI0019D71591|nr:acyl-CoA dehydrogenase family protein [Erythrobacter sp. NAP1]